MSQSMLYDAVTRLAELSHLFTDADLGQPWRWRAHEEGVRFALLGTYHELRDLAVALAHERAKDAPPLTAAQRATAPYHAAYRDLQAVLLGVDEEIYDAIPAPGEWELRYILAHIVGAERHFFTLVHYGLRRQRDGGALPARLPDGETDRVLGPAAGFGAIMEEQGMAEMVAFYDALHQRALDTFAGITDEELAGPSVWWEEDEVSLQYRLHRFDAHLRQHLIQAEKCLAATDHGPNEAIRLLRLVYQALADVENVLLGANGLGKERQRALAEKIAARAEGVVEAVAQAHRMVAAVGAGDLEQVKGLLAEEPKLANCIDQRQLSVVLMAAYRQQREMVAALVAAGAQLSLFDAAAIGRLDVVKQKVEQWADTVNEFGIDGFTALQLACFFNHEEIALWLIEQGADVNAVAQNQQRIQPIHAAATTGNLKVVGALLAHGADGDGKQVNDFTPLHTAAANGNGDMVRMLLAHGVERDPVTEDGLTPLALAQENGHDEVVALL